MKNTAILLTILAMILGGCTAARSPENNNIITTSEDKESEIKAVEHKQVFYRLAQERTAKRKSSPQACYDMAADGFGGGYLAPSPAEAQNWNTESYDAIKHNIYHNTLRNPLSTFSIDVDTASYANMRRFINNGSLPPRDAVRIEEMINYFSYNYPEAKDEPFSVYYEVSQCPWAKDHKLLHLGLKGKSIDTAQMPANNLVFLLDVSGSMSSPNKLPLLKKAFKLLVGQMRQQDRVAIVVYAGAAGLVLPSTPGSEKDKILAALDRLNAGGSTAGGAGIKLAYKTASDYFIKKGNNRIILATDGDFNIGASSDAAMVELVEQKRNNGIFLTVLGFGMGNYKDSKMEKLADKGNGNYAYIDNILEAKKVLVEEMGSTLLTIAKDVKIQVEFNPGKIVSYRLIGYENRLLNAEDFNDDTKDAGEIGAGHTVTALYELVPVGSKDPSGKIDELKYQSTGKADTEHSGELLTVKLRYKKPDGDKSSLIRVAVPDRMVSLENASEDLRFSAAVAEFGLVLRKDTYAEKASMANAIRMAKAAKGNDEFGYRNEFIRLAESCGLLN